METVIKHMRENNYTEEEMNKFKEGNGLQWKTDEDLPDGWRYGIYHNFKQGQLKNYMDPNGKFYGSIAQILKYFLEVDPNGEDMEKTKKYLLKDGWFVTDLLPPGWYMKQKKSEHVHENNSAPDIGVQIIWSHAANQIICELTFYTTRY